MAVIGKKPFFALTCVIRYDTIYGTRDMSKKECVFLIPTSYNDKRKVAVDVIDEILDRVFEEFGPYSVDGVTDGTWKMHDGTKAEDRCLKVWIILEEENVDELKKMLKSVARELDQEAIFFMTRDVETELIEPE